MKKSLRYRTKTLDNLKQEWGRWCNKCNEVKPGRTYHCAVCNHCVFMLDHHCPWVNNCLGMENYRYFLLFIFYLMLGTIFNLLTIVSIWDHHSYVSPPPNVTFNQKKHIDDFSFMLTINSSLSVVMVGFNGFNWFLACSGMTQVEMSKMAQHIGRNYYNYSYQSVSDNLFVIFGTTKVMRMFSPSLRALPLTGLEFSFQMKEAGYDEEGFGPDFSDEEPSQDLEMPRVIIQTEEEKSIIERSSVQLS